MTRRPATNSSFNTSNIVHIHHYLGRRVWRDATCSWTE